MMAIFHCSTTSRVDAFLPWSKFSSPDIRPKSPRPQQQRELKASDFTPKSRSNIHQDLKKAQFPLLK